MRMNVYGMIERLEPETGSDRSIVPHKVKKSAMENLWKESHSGKYIFRIGSYASIFA